MSDETKGELYEIINPSDPYTFRASDDKVAEAVVLLIGDGAYGCLRVEDDETIGGMLAFVTKKQAEEHIGFTFGNLGDYLRANKDEIIAALDSVLCMKAGERFTYESALELIEGDEKKKTYRDGVHDKLRSSMNDIGAYAWKLAARFREAAEEEKRFPPYEDCESELGCRCIVEDGKSKAVKDDKTCEACSKRDGLKKVMTDELVITPATSKKVGLKKPEGVLHFPSMAQVEEAVKNKDVALLLTWHRFLESPATEEGRAVIDKIVKVVGEAMKRGRS